MGSGADRVRAARTKPVDHARKPASRESLGERRIGGDPLANAVEAIHYSRGSAERRPPTTSTSSRARGTRSREDGRWTRGGRRRLGGPRRLRKRGDHPWRFLAGVNAGRSCGAPAERWRGEARRVARGRRGGGRLNGDDAPTRGSARCGTLRSLFSRANGTVGPGTPLLGGCLWPDISRSRSVSSVWRLRSSELPRAAARRTVWPATGRR